MDVSSSRHSYLPGVPIPLYPEEWLMRRNEQELENEAVIPILPIVSVFLFPGSSLPMRIRQTAWVDYLTETIAESRKILGSQVRIGIVTLTRDRSMTLDDENCVVGMIGTFATITYIHEGETRDYDTADIPGQRARPNIHPREIVVTMVGTGRFRAIAQKQDMDTRELPMYTVTNMDDRVFTLPREIHYRLPCLMLPREGLRLLSKISSVPSLAFQALWPWTLVEEIIKALYQNPALEGLRNSQTSSGYPQNFILRPTHLDMVDFSFWLAAEIPMGEKERLELLQKSCTVERLLFIRNILQSTEPVAFVRCVRCNSNIARVSDIFTVDRAHGTNGAYVNPHGIIHQTWTVRQVCEDSTLITGSPETKDSWFPGYGWNVCYCMTCYNHLGWKFSRESTSENYTDESSNNDRPVVFYGLSMAQTSI